MILRKKKEWNLFKMTPFKGQHNGILFNINPKQTKKPFFFLLFTKNVNFYFTKCCSMIIHQRQQKKK